ncbi:MAG: AAA family ATPase [Ignavibacteriae bacterium]|nr:MinD/ParA family protein [Ignavibacteriota bacterium]NOG97155.1 AAA family ATPase [Ignavibacteriota bacterium]
MIGQAERIIELSKLNTGSGSAGKRNIISFTSGKGGTGKTVLSVNTAYALSKQGKKVLLVDLDSNLSNINILLNVYAENTIANFLEGKKLFSDLIYEHDSNLHVIFGDSGNTEYPKPRIDLIKFIFVQISKIQNDYDFVIIDSTAGIDEDVLTILKNSDLNIIVTTTEPTAVMDAYVVLKFLKKNNILSSSKILVNKCFDNSDADSAEENLKQASIHFLKQEVSFLGKVGFDTDVNKSIINQNILVKENPDNKTSKQIYSLSAQLEKLIQVVNNSQSAKVTFSK